MRLIVADDSLLLREGISRLLVEARFQVVGLASTGEEALAQVERNKPDVAIVDIRMPPTHSDEGLKAAHRQPRATQEKVEILESVGQMVLAAHRTAVGSGLTAVTVEAVTLDSPNSTDEVPWVVYQDDVAGREA